VYKNKLKSDLEKLKYFKLGFVQTYLENGKSYNKSVGILQIGIVLRMHT
jgi:hypothetical protein